ncbi:MAG: ABC transporter ATP-binding protein, partial [Magnetococcales bacterium]|nr:ABC transporter ATP-binding protein [Magnetococcales bacterium]
MSALLTVEKLSVHFPTSSGRVAAVQQISWHIGAGEVVALVGESGSGKSMTALALLDLLPRHAIRQVDRIDYAGRPIHQLDAPGMEQLRGREIAMIFQEPMTALNPLHTIGKQLTEPLLWHRLLRNQPAILQQAVLELLERTGLQPAERYPRAYPHQL